MTAVEARPGAGAGPGGALTGAERDRLLATLAPVDALVLAISGGPDSMALLHLVHAWCHERGRPLATVVAVTVDHGLRAESAAEAVAVAQHARRLGIAHRTVRWTGPAPASGLQAAARAARYRLLSEVARQMADGVGGPAAIVTAHTADDQAETLLMRLARGSGVDGLASIPSHGSAIGGGADVGRHHPIPVLRPLLDVPRQRLLATLEANAVPFADDPSNRDRRFERVRVREALDVLATLGVTREALQRSARRLQSAREVLELAADELESRIVSSVPGLLYQVEMAPFGRAPQETAVRLLRRLLARAGGSAPPADLGTIEASHARLIAAGTQAPTFTLGGCIVEPMHRPGAPTPEHIRIYREPDRHGGLPTIELAEGETVRWDDRFEATVGRGFPGKVEVGPLGADWRSLLEAFPGLVRLGLPHAAARGCPAFRQAGRLVAAPTIEALAERIGEADAASCLAGPTSPESGAGMVPLLSLTASGSSGPLRPRGAPSENGP